MNCLPIGFTRKRPVPKELHPSSIRLTTDVLLWSLKTLRDDERQREFCANTRRLNNMDSQDFTEEMFKQCPVWRWNSSNDGYCPVHQNDPLPEDEPTLFIKANFESPSGESFRGYLVGSDSFYAFGLFVDGGEYVVNLNLPETLELASKAISEKLKTDRFQLLPLKYSTGVHFSGNSNISGILTLSGRGKD